MAKHNNTKISDTTEGTPPPTFKSAGARLPHVGTMLFMFIVPPLFWPLNIIFGPACKNAGGTDVAKSYQTMLVV